MNYSKILRFYGVVRNGVRLYYKPGLHSQLLKDLEGKEFEETLAFRREEATKNEHGFYRVLTRWLTFETELFGGWDENVVHKFFANEFLSHTETQTIHLNDGIEKTVSFKVTRSTAELSKAEMAEFIGKVIRWLADQGIVAPDPEDFVVKKYRKKPTV